MHKILSRMCHAPTRLLIVVILAATSLVGLSRGALCFAQSSGPASSGRSAPLNGDVAKVGVGYSLGAGKSSYTVTVRKFAFVATRITLNGLRVFPDADKKFLVIDYAVQNSDRISDADVSGTTFSMTAVDGAGQKYDVETNIENTTTNEPLGTGLKPGQRVECRAYIVVPAAASIPKLLLSAGGSKVVRFDLHNAVAPVEPIVADPADKTGAAARAVIADAKIGVTYPTGPFDMTLEKTEFTDLPINGVAPDVGTRFFVATIRVKNALTPAAGDADITNAGAASWFVLMSDSQRIESNGDYYSAATDDLAKTTVPPGFEKHFRLCFQVPKGGSVKLLSLVEGERYRKLIYNVHATR